MAPEKQVGSDDFKTKRAEVILESSNLDFMTDNLHLTNAKSRNMVHFEGHSKVDNKNLSKRLGGQYKGAPSNDTPLQKKIVNKKRSLKHVDRRANKKLDQTDDVSQNAIDQTVNKSGKINNQISANQNSKTVTSEISANQNTKIINSGEVENASSNQNQYVKHVAGNLQDRPMSSPVPNRSGEKEDVRVQTSCSDPDDSKPSEASVGRITRDHNTSTQHRALMQNSLRTRQKSRACIVM